MCVGMPLDNKQLQDLRRIAGRDNVRDSIEERLLHAYDGTREERLPDAVVRGVSTEQIAAIMRWANETRISIYPRGAATGLSGGSVPAEGGIALALAGMNRIVEIDPGNLTAVTEPGVVNADLSRAASGYGLFFPPDPASMTVATIGGNVAENAGGLRGAKYGVTRDWILALEVVLPTGDVIQTGARTMKNVVGYDIMHLLVGSEGTLGIFTKITARLHPIPPARRTLLAFCRTARDAAQAAKEIIAAKIVPAVLEYMDRVTMIAIENYTKTAFPSEAEAALLIEVDGPEQTVADEARRIEELLTRQSVISTEVAGSEEAAERLWDARRAAAPALTTIAPLRISEDVCVPRADLPEMCEYIPVLRGEFGIEIAAFGHVGDGNLHVNMLIDPHDQPQADRAHAAIEKLFDKAIALGGTISGEHGIGTQKAWYVERQLGPVQVELMKSIKRAFDPNNVLNPHKMFLWRPE
jgi:glycolate oxidase